jgi:hypothetical protein
MNEIEICLQNKITTAVGVLQPTILTAILNLYLRGNLQMNAEMVRNECIIINNEESWKTSIPAICNSMRNAIECGGRIVGEDRDFLGFTIAFNGNSKSNLDQTKNNINPIIPLVDKDDKSNSKMKTLIIIPCCKRKLMGGIQINQPQTFFENDNILPELILKRNNRIQNIPVIDHFDFLPAWERYDGHLYRNLKVHQILIDSLIQHGYLDIIIISALYGVINYNTPINNYDLRINQLNGVNYWRNQNTLSNAINLYC